VGEDEDDSGIGEGYARKSNKDEMKRKIILDCGRKKPLIWEYWENFCKYVVKFVYDCLCEINIFKYMIDFDFAPKVWYKL